MTTMRTKKKIPCLLLVLLLSVATVEGFAPQQQTLSAHRLSPRTVLQRKERLHSAETSHEETENQSCTTPFVKSPLFSSQRSSSSTTTKCKGTFFQRLFLKCFTLVVATSIALASSLVVQPTAPAFATSTQPKMETVNRNRQQQIRSSSGSFNNNNNDKYSVSFWTPEMEASGSASTPSSRANAKASIPKKASSSSAFSSSRRPTVSVEASPKTKQTTTIKKKVIRRKTSPQLSPTKLQRQQCAMTPNRGGHYALNSYDTNAVLSQSSPLAVVAWFFKIALVLSIKMTLVASLVVVAVVVGSEETADSLRERLVDQWDQFHDKRNQLFMSITSNNNDNDSESFQNRAQETWQQLWKGTVAMTTILNHQIQTKSKLLSQKARIQWNKTLATSLTLRRILYNIPKKWRQQKGSSYDQDESYYAANQDDKAQHDDRFDEFHPTTSANTLEEVMSMDPRLTHVYNRVREEERHKQMKHVMLRKSSEDNPQHHQASKFLAQPPKQSTSSQPMTGYGLRRSSASSNGVQSGKTDHNYDDAFKAASKDNLRKILQTEESHKDAIPIKDAKVVYPTSSSSLLPSPEAALTTAMITTMKQPSSRKKNKFDIRYMLWKLLARQNIVTHPDYFVSQEEQDIVVDNDKTSSAHHVMALPRKT